MCMLACVYVRLCACTRVCVCVCVCAHIGGGGDGCGGGDVHGGEAGWEGSRFRPNFGNMYPLSMVASL